MSKNSRKGVAISKAPAGHRVEFHYIKGPDFRTLHIDGAIGGVTSRGYLHASLYSERPAIPQKTVSKVLQSGGLEPLDSETETRGGIVRQMETDIFLDKAAATELRDWLSEKLLDFERREEIIKEGQK